MGPVPAQSIRRSARIATMAVIAGAASLTAASQASADPVPGPRTVIELCREATGTLVGTSRDDVIRGTPEADVIVGLGGDDRIKGRDGDDLICGGKGNDQIFGGAGDDLAFAGLPSSAGCRHRTTCAGPGDLLVAVPGTTS